MPHETRKAVKRKVREKYVEEIVRLCAEISLSEQIEELFELAQVHREELENKVRIFKKTDLWKKIQMLDNELNLVPIFKKQLNGHDEELIEYDARINPKALFVLILSMRNHAEDDFFEDPQDFVIYLNNIGEIKLAKYVERKWLRGKISEALWLIYDDDD